ncbi:MAG TPA: KTSC domain-containing protein [Ktedonobacteraceae bacterium]|nr:KTSC domain-containing protein [Ktedonobacteraceae bacterium]
MPPVTPIPHQQVKSSAIQSLGHDARSQTLEVTYHDRGTYRYQGVSSPEHLSILSAPSKGKALNSLIKRRKLTGVRMDKK